MGTLRTEKTHSDKFLWVFNKGKWLRIYDCPLKQAEHNYKILKQRLEEYEKRIEHLAQRAFSEAFYEQNWKHEDRQFKFKKTFTPLELEKWQLQREIYQAYGRLENAKV